MTKGKYCSKSGVIMDVGHFLEVLWSLAGIEIEEQTLFGIYSGEDRIIIL